ncbi:MAG: serine/threonine protein kinase, partial [Mariniblastus sp.]
MAKTNKTRYKITEQIGSGDFAKVYSAEDTKLGRKVAIKQLHSHFNDNPEKMARYWSEAQLLLDIEHPNIMTIYDVVKSRGCLVLELMQGSLNQIYEDKPMPVQDVKETLLQAAKGLDCLHQNGIIHGDVKPANLMLSRQGIVKLGDFGLARRVNDDDGSLLKGTTKYMAPELVSEDFGEVGHASDLYSLGFSALELLIGPDFDSLFPDLIAFGRDKQMAWMMWHCSADREFPPLQSVLEGVPDDLANVLQKLTAKKQANRYRTAEALISDLTEGAKPVGESLRDDELAAAETARLAKRKRRVKAIIACCVSFIACIVIWWLSLPADIAPPITLNPPLRGVIQNVQSHDNKLVVDKGVDFKELDLRKSDVILLNRKQRQLRDLKLGDRIVVKDVRDGDYTKHREFIAFRPESRRGSITAVDLKNGKITASLETDGDPETLDLIVNDETEFSINQSTARRGNALQSLAAEDLISVEISDDESGVLTLQIDAIRLVQLEGFIRKLNPKAGTITLAVISDSNSTDSNASELVTIPIDSNCDFSLNGLLAVNDQVLTVQNIAIGDRVNISHDIAIKRLDAYRSYSEQGRILSLNYDELTLELKLPTATAPKHYRVEKQMAFNLQGQAATFGDLRVGDNIQLKHDSPDTSEPVLNSLEATRPVNKNR